MIHVLTNNTQKFQLFIWLLGFSVTGAAVFAWSQFYLTGGLTLYKLFPLLGLLAWSLMWTHYVGGALQRYLDQDSHALRRYFRLTSALVLTLILLHPGLFALQLSLDGLGFPPASYYSVYTGTAPRIALLLGTISLVIFLAFELHHKFGTASWWKYVDYANILAMFAIFYHALRLGGVFYVKWYATVWFAYGIVLLISIAYNHNYDKRSSRE